MWMRDLMPMTRCARSAVLILCALLCPAFAGCDSGGGDVGDDDTGSGATSWAVFAHPCVGSRTDALHCDSAEDCFVGCGTTTVGRGLFLTADGGETWDVPSTTPANVLDDARVNDITRSADGMLYVSGEIAGDTNVVSLDSSGNLAEVWNRRSTVDFSFTAGSFRRNSDGFSFVESSTGVDILYRSDDSGDPATSWSTARGFWNDGDEDDVPSGVQMLQLDEHDGVFYGAGSRINQSPMAFIWDGSTSDPDFDIIELAADGLSAFEGEMWGIDVNDDGIVVGGVNQDDDFGVIFTHPGTGDTAASTWTRYDLRSVFPDDTTWVEGVCRGDGVIYAVGRESISGWGFVLRSTDEGATFEDISLYEDGESDTAFPDLTRCYATETGVVVTGGDGVFAVYTE